MAIFAGFRPASSQQTSVPELELKFVLPAAFAPVLVQWLAAHCRPHPEFPSARTSSVYYDTGDWDLLSEKLGSDYFKRKVRLRWYGGSDPEPGSPAFMEAKLKEGARRDKVRALLPGGAAHWAATPLECESFAEALRVLHGEGVTDTARLRPAFQIGYWRRRFVHPFTHASLSLDTDIRVERIHRSRFRHRPDTALPVAVLEQKSPRGRLDPVFGDLSRYDVRQTSFSKYQHCYSHLTGTFF